MSATADPIIRFRAELVAAASRKIGVRRRRLFIAGAAATVGVLTASLALAANKTGWLTGEPAPPKVVTGFRQYTPQLGFHPEAGKAQFVAQDGPVRLYATANREGGICFLIDEPTKSADAGDGGTCAGREKASVPISAGWLGGSPGHFVVAGRVADEHATTVSFEGPSGDTIVRTLGAGGFYVAQVPWSEHCPKKSWQPLFVAADAAGARLAEARILVLETDFDAQGRALGCGGEVTPHGPYAKLPAATSSPR
jgi:hypothetical protein